MIRNKCNQNQSPSLKTKVGNNSKYKKVKIQREHVVNLMSSYLPKRWPLSYTELNII